MHAHLHLFRHLNIEQVMFSSEKDKGKIFNFGDAVMASLRRSMNRSLMTSCHIVFDVVRKHHQQYVEGATDKHSCVRFLKLWSHRPSFLRQLLVPMLKASLSSQAAFATLRIMDSTSVDAPASPDYMELDG